LSLAAHPRILIGHPGPLPDYSVHDVYTGWIEALIELGCEVAPFNLNDRLVAFSSALVDTHQTDETGHPIVRTLFTDEQVFYAAMEGLSHSLLTFWPDVVLFVSGFYLSAGTLQLLRMRNFRIVLLHTETPYQDEEQLMRGQLADLNLLNDAVSLDKFREIGPAEYMPHAYRPRVHYPLGKAQPTPGLASDLCFIGSAFKSRVEFFSQRDLTGIDALFAGNDWGKIPPSSPLAPLVGTGLTDADCVDNVQAAGLYRHAKTGINFYRREGEEGWDKRAWAMGPREVEMAACGLFSLRDPRGEGDEVLPMLPTFDSPGDASEKLRWWLKHDAEREAAAQQARAAIADRTFENNARKLLQILDKLG
jgi:spore maturation protein CgeB